MQHRFVVGQQDQAASNNHLPLFNSAMKKFNARRKFKASRATAAPTACLQLFRGLTCRRC